MAAQCTAARATLSSLRLGRYHARVCTPAPAAQALSTSQWIKKNHDSFPQFAGWGKEYGAFTYALRDKEMVANYIRNQRAHHQRESFEEEYRKHLQNAGIEWNDYCLT